MVGADGKRYYPKAKKQAGRESLYVISQVPGYTRIRGPQFWQAGPIAPGPQALSTRLRMNTSKAVLAGNQPIPFDAATFDEIGAWSASLPNQLTVPEGVTRLLIGGNVRTAGGSSTNVAIQIRINGAVIASQQNASGYQTIRPRAQTGTTDVTAAGVKQCTIKE